MKRIMVVLFLCFVFLGCDKQNIVVREVSIFGAPDGETTLLLSDGDFSAPLFVWCDRCGKVPNGHGCSE